MTDKTKTTTRKSKARGAQPGEPADGTTAAAEPQTLTATAEDAPPAADAPPPEPVADASDADAGLSYKAVFTSATKGFELVEDRRYKQRAFRFKERPGDVVLAVLKANGFTYRPAEKAWTVPITAESRVLTDRLAREFAGGGPSTGRG